MLVQICFVALFTSVAVAVSSDRSYDQKATVIKNNLLACTISTNSLDECINSWSLKYATHNLPKASEMTVNQRNAFFSNVNAVIALNSKVNLTWIADLNAFSHFTLDEFKSNYMAGNLTLPTSESINLKVETPRNITLDAVDWSDVTFNGIQSIASVKDQGNQGVSW